MRMGKRRGMRDIATIQSLAGRSIPQSREHIAAELARLEHEKARLERELNMWANNVRRTEEQIQHIEDRLTLLQQAIDRPRQGEPTSEPVLPSSSQESGNDWQAVVLEY